MNMTQLLSRECIRDTLMYKRDKAQWKQSGLARSLYVRNIRMLRAGQLAPQTDSLQADRYGKRLALKQAAADIVIVVRGGLVQSVRSTNPFTRVYVADYDGEHDSPDEEAMLNDAEERGNASDMYTVF